MYDQVCTELKNGKKNSHWMWFVFPQLRGLGKSSTATYYGIDSFSEAQAYLRHPVLGDRLIACTELVCQSDVACIDELFAFPDNLKFHSCMTLFSCARQYEPIAGGGIFDKALDQFYGGRQDAGTLSLLKREGVPFKRSI